MTPEEERQLAVDLFNRTWKLMELPGRTPEQDDELIHAAHASRHHWAAVGTPANLARGEWQLSRVYVVLGRPEPALYHARRCLAYCEGSPEALARAHRLAGDADDAARHAAQARELAQRVADPEDRDHLEEDLATL